MVRVEHDDRMCISGIPISVILTGRSSLSTSCAISIQLNDVQDNFLSTGQRHYLNELFFEHSSCYLQWF
ncbi:hypothetical protein SUGI_0691920 [Cryptomeria japonica]|nr:hypothetical protein SUGI_0691920 [Cryptomeria japonica]